MTNVVLLIYPDVLSCEEIECDFVGAQQLAGSDGTCFTVVVLVFGVTAPMLGVLYNTRKDSNTTFNSL